MADPERTNQYLKYYENQAGGSYPVFHGSRQLQYGAGFGDVLKGIFRFILPVVARGASTFLGDMMRNRDAGHDWKSSAKSAIGPTAQSVMSQVANQLPQQEGAGKVRHRKQRTKKRRLYKGVKRNTSSSFDTYSNKIPKFNF